MKISANMKVLIIDDMAVMRKYTKKALRDVGLKNIHEAANGKEAFEFVQNAHGSGDPVEFIISDWNMPVMSGLNLLELLRSDKRFSNIPFLMVTAEASGDQVKAAIDKGVDHYIVKPFSPDILRNKLEFIFKKLGAK